MISMIDFACKRFQIKEVVKCSLGLTKADYNIMEFLIKNKERTFTTQQIAIKNKLDLSTVQRAVKKLTEKKAVIRLQENLANGGYQFTYQIESMPKIRKIISEIAHRWAGKVDEELEYW